jgi:hypothetical protein
MLQVREQCLLRQPSVQRALADSGECARLALSLLLAPRWLKRFECSELSRIRRIWEARVRVCCNIPTNWSDCVGDRRRRRISLD